MTKVASVWVIGMAAIFAICLGFLGKFTALISTIPSPVLGGVSLLLYGFIAVNGLKVLIENRVNMGKSRNVIIASTMLVLGLGGAVLNIGTVSVSGMSLAAVAGVLLNLFLPREGDEDKPLEFDEKEEEKENKKDSKNEDKKVASKDNKEEIKIEDKNLVVLDHPLIEHKLSILRDKNTGTKEFRELVAEIGMFVCYEAMTDAKLEDTEIETPMTTLKTKKLNEDKYAFLPILRAGTGMLDGLIRVIPNAKRTSRC